jgi:hypothetical protein
MKETITAIKTANAAIGVKIKRRNIMKSIIMAITMVVTANISNAVENTALSQLGNNIPNMEMPKVFSPQANINVEKLDVPMASEAYNVERTGWSDAVKKELKKKYAANQIKTIPELNEHEVSRLPASIRARQDEENTHTANGAYVYKMTVQGKIAFLVINYDDDSLAVWAFDEQGIEMFECCLSAPGVCADRAWGKVR